MSATIESQQPASSNQSFDSRAASSLSFPKLLRLLESGDFQRVFDDAPFRASHQNFLILARSNELGYPRIGLVIAKKHLRLAVERNRFKRLIREHFRLHQHKFGGVDVIVLSRKGLENLDNQTFTHQLNQQWQRILKKSRQHGLRSQPHVATKPEHPANDNAQATDH